MSQKKLLNKNFLLLFQGQFISQICTSIHVVGMLFWLKQTTHSATLMGSLYIVGMIPAALLAPLGGVVADRCSRTAIIVIVDFIRGVLVVSVAIIILLSPEATELTISLLFLVMCSGSILVVFFRPAIHASIPDLVPFHKIETANGLLQSSMQMSLLIGQSLGGLLFVMLGMPILMLVSGIAFLLSALSECWITIPKKTAVKAVGVGSAIRDFKEDIVAGFHYVRYKKGLLDLFLAMAITNFFIAPFGILLPFLVEDTLHSTPKWYGFLMAGLAFGVLVGSMLAGMLRLTAALKGRLVAGALLLFSLGLSIVGYSASVVIALFILIVLGTCSGFTVVLINSVIQRSTPINIRGRVFGFLMTISTVLVPTSIGLAGVLADLVNHNVAVIFAGGGISCLIATSLLLLGRGFYQLFIIAGQPADDSYDVLSP